MRFPPSFLDELRARLSVSEVVGKRVTLKKAGREWKGLSPFNKERTPSFTVNDQKGFFHDFSSGKHGDIFRFVMETEGLTFPEAVEELAHRAGMSLPVASRESVELEERRKNAHEVLELAAKFFENTLNSQQGAKARGYLADRGILPATQLEFRIGYAPAQRFALKEYLGAQGISIDDMIEVGLLISGEDIPIPYDRFRDRVIIPIHDHSGRVIAFGGRALSNEIQPKYLNSPETPLFHKSEVVFNFHRARSSARRESFLIAVEGYMDAISLYQAGLKSTVALMGTAFTEEQIQALWRLAPEPIICFDGDKAGLSAAERSIERILPLLRTGNSFRFAFLPGLDPDELIRNQGVERFNSIIKDALPFWDMVWEREFNRGEIRTPDQKAMFERSIMSLVSQIGDALLRRSYQNRARAQLVALFQSLDWHAAIKPKAAAASLSKSEFKLGARAPLESLEKILLGTLIEYPDLLEINLERLMVTELTGKLDKFKSEIYRIFQEFNDRLVTTFYKEIDVEFSEILADVHGYMDPSRNKATAINLYRRFPLLRLDPPQEFVARCVELFFEKLELRQLKRELTEIRADVSRIAVEEELERYTKLAQECLDVEGTIEARDRDLANEARDLRRMLARNEEVMPAA